MSENSEVQSGNTGEVSSGNKTKLELELERSELGGAGRGASSSSGVGAVAMVLIVALLALLVYEHMRVTELEKTVSELSSKFETLHGAGVAGVDESKSQAVEKPKAADEDKSSVKGKEKTRKTARQKK